MIQQLLVSQCFIGISYRTAIGLVVMKGVNDGTTIQSLYTAIVLLRWWCGIPQNERAQNFLKPHSLWQPNREVELQYLQMVCLLKPVSLPGWFPSYFLLFASCISTWNDQAVSLYMSPEPQFNLRYKDQKYYHDHIWSPIIQSIKHHQQPETHRNA